MIFSRVKRANNCDLSRNPVIEAHGKLIGNGGHFGGRGVGARAVGTLRIVGQRIAGQQFRDLRVHRNNQRVAGKGGGIEAGALGDGGNGDHLGGAQHLAETLVLDEVISLVAAVVQMRESPLVRRWSTPNSLRMNGGMRRGSAMERRSKKLRASSAELRRNSNDRSVHGVGAGARDDVGEARGAASDFGRHPTGAGADFLHGIDVEIGEGGAAHLGIGAIGAIHGEDGRGAALAVHRELLREIRRAVGVRHGAGREQQQLAEVALVQRQRRDGLARELLAAGASLGGRRGLAPRGCPPHSIRAIVSNRPAANGESAGFSPFRRG